MKNLLVLIAILGMLASTACSRNQAIGAGVGAAAGGLAGGIIGHQNNDKWEGAAIGAGVGAAVGAGIGYYMDRQAKKYEEIPGVEVTESGDADDPVKLRMDTALLFAKDSSTVIPAGVTKLEEVAAVMVEYPNTKMRVTGHASSEGAEDYNMRLSERRADAVTAILIRNGVAPERIWSVGMGETMPVASNDTEAGRVQNRRVEIELVPWNPNSNG